ncbi:MAG TPA: sigma-70 family RNA polymerase sigma factor [Kofleriaceae bacterium]|nr:sigma-70 family RNA polymerase sigma factor [Kofleriaceae bacterium]
MPDLAPLLGDDGVEEKRAPVRRRAASDDDKGSFLAKYFRDMAALDVMEPEQEFRAARELEALEIEIWKAILTHAPATDHALGLVETCMDNSMSEFRTLRRLADAARREPAKPSRAKAAPSSTQGKLDKAVAKVAPKLRAMDTDRNVLDAVLGELDRIRRDRPGRIAKQKPPFSPTTGATRAYLARVARADRAAGKARDAFVLANLRLVVSIARRFNHGRMALADLIQEGNIGLMKAVERYDYRRGFRFSTYASWWIRHAISRALADKGREVRLPVHMIDAYHRIAKAKRELNTKLGRQPTSEELSQATHIAAGKIEKMRTYLVDQSMSLDRPVSEDDGRHFIEFLQDPVTEDAAPADRMTTQAMTEEVRELLRDLKPIEADILRQRFGLDDDRELTLKEIGEKYNLSRERIRQLQEQALSKMRRALTRKELE